MLHESQNVTSHKLIFSNREERIIKSYNFLTGLSDYNMILTSRKLTKKHFSTLNQSKTYELSTLQPDLTILESELNKMQWNKAMDKDDVH